MTKVPSAQRLADREATPLGFLDDKAPNGNDAREFQDSLAANCSSYGVPANFLRSRRDKSSSELRGR